MPEYPYPAYAPSQTGHIQGRAGTSFTTLETVLPLRLNKDFRFFTEAAGTITDRVMLRTGVSTEVPFANGRIWLLRLADGFKAWEGWSDSDGYYTATGLELGVEYIAVGIDPLRNHKATGAGPVTATLPEAP